MKNNTNYRGNNSQQLQNFKKALEDLQDKANTTQADIDKFKGFEQEKIKAHQPEHAKRFADSAAKLECKLLAYKDAIRIISKHVAV